jgi:hypothetical protein
VAELRAPSEEVGHPLASRLCIWPRDKIVCMLHIYKHRFAWLSFVYLLSREAVISRTCQLSTKLMYTILKNSVPVSQIAHSLLLHYEDQSVDAV